MEDDRKQKVLEKHENGNKFNATNMNTSTFSSLDFLSMILYINHLQTCFFLFYPHFHSKESFLYLYFSNFAETKYSCLNLKGQSI